MVFSTASRATASRPARRRAALPASLVAAATAAAAYVGSRSFSTGFTSPPQQHLRSGKASALEEEEEAAPGGLRRREAAAGFAAATGLSTILGAELPAVAEVDPKADARLQRLLINIESDQAMENEIKFWKDALGMKVLSDGKVADGNREVIMSYESEKSAGSFAIQARIDPALAARAKPKLLNFDVLQPTVDALNFVQVSQPKKVIEVFEKVQASGGDALIGDFGYFDVTSPRDVPVRIVTKEGEPPKVDHVSMNIEVPAFEATNKFYQRAFNFQEVTYPSDQPPVQQLSKYYESKSGGPKLLLSPVPDKRLKDRQLDEFEGLLLVTGSTPTIVNQAQAAVDLAEKEEAAKKEAQKEAEKELMGAKGTIRTKKVFEETVAKPSVTPAISTAGLTTVDDGLGNVIYIASQDEFAKRVA